MTPDKRELVQESSSRPRSHQKSNASRWSCCQGLPWCPPEGNVRTQRMARVNASKDKKSGKAEPRSENRATLWFTRDTLSKAFASGGCAVCNAVHAAERKSIHSFLYEGMMFPSVRQKFLAGGGFCLRHFWMAKEIEDEAWQTGGFGLAILCEDLARSASSGLAAVKAIDPTSRSGFFRRSEPQGFVPGQNCMFCQDNREKAQFLGEALEELSEEEEFRGPLTANGLCIPHGQVALRIWRDPAKRDRLFSQLEARVTELGNDLREFIRKHDYQYRDEPLGREQDSVVRSMRLFVGPDPCREHHTETG